MNLKCLVHFAPLFSASPLHSFLAVRVLSIWGPSSQFSYLGHNFLEKHTVSLLWQFCHGNAVQCMPPAATAARACLAPVIFLHSSMASTFMITSRTNAAFDCGSFLFVLPSSAVCKTHSGRKSISRGPLNDI